MRLPATLRQLILFSLTIIGLTGILFADCSEVAYSAMRMWQALGLVICFTTAEAISFHAQVLVLLGTVILAGIVNVIVEFTTQPKEELFPCVYRKRRPKENDNMLSNSSSTKLTQDTVKEPIDDIFSDHTTAAQNPIFIVYEGRRPSASVSTLSGDSLESNPPSTMKLTSLICNGHRPGLDSASQDERLTSRNSRSTLFVVSSSKTLSSLDPIKEYEENRDHPSIIDSHKASIQRSPSYLAALNNIVTVDDVNVGHC